MILFTGGVCLSACWDTTPPSRPPQTRHHHPRPDTPPGADTPLGADPPGEQTPPPADTPPDQAHPTHPPWHRACSEIRYPAHPPPPAQSMLGDTVNARAVRILLECNLVFTFQLFHRKQNSSIAFLSEVVSVINWTKVIDGSSSHQELVSVHVTLFHLLVSLASNQDVSQVTHAHY